MRKPKVIIAGAGLGGLTLAGLLHQRGFETIVCEQSPVLGEIGAGIQISPNAVKVLRALGVEEGLRRVGFEPVAFAGWDWHSGRQLYWTPMKEIFMERYGAGYFHVHRADLHALLVATVPESVFRLGAKVTGVVEGEKTAAVRLADGSEIEGDVVIGADGIQSAVRNSLFGDLPAQFTGNICWRGVVATVELPPNFVPPTSSNWPGPHGHVVHYYIRGGALVNFVAVRETDQWTAESWNIPSSREELLAGFEGWHPRIRTLFERAGHLYKWGLFDRDPLPHWTKGRVTLMGDAAHPMLPFLAQGAAQAIEDGYALAAWLDACPADPERALVSYETERMPRTARVQIGARARGKTLHLTSAFARFKRNLRFQLMQWKDPTLTPHSVEWVFSHDVTGPRTEPGGASHP